MLFIVGIIAAAIVVLSALYGVVALMIEYRKRSLKRRWSAVQDLLLVAKIVR